MTKKILFFLTFLLTTLGGGNFALAEDITYNFSAYLSGIARTANTQNCSLTPYSGSSQQNIPAGTACSGYYYEKINGDDYYYVIDGYKDFAAGDVLTVYLYGNGTTVGCLVGSAKKKLELTTATKSEINTIEYTLVAGDIESDGTLRIYRDGGSTYFAGVSIASTRTIASDNTIQTYPYTWDFSDKTNDQWVQTFKDMGLYTTSSPAQWTHIISDEPAANYRPAVARSNWQYDVALLKGLKFNKATIYSPCLDYQYQHLWVEEGTIITIPSVKAGQKIVLIGDNVHVTSTSNLTEVTANSQYKVDANGDVTLTFDASHIKTISVQKIEQTLSFAEPEITISYDDATPTNALNQSVGDGAVTYSSSNDHVATVNAEGELSIKNSGTCIITATAAETTTYAQTSASYTLTVNATQSAPTITMYKNYSSHQEVVDNGASLTATFGDNVYVTGICEPEGPTVKYRSSDESVATVDGSGAVTTKKGGDVVITVYTDSYKGYPAASVSYNLHINPALFDFKFKPYNEGTINVGATITPQMTIPTLMLEDVISITASSSDPTKATVPMDLLEHSGASYPYLDVADGRINRIKPVITGVAVGDATITVNFTSKNYTSSSAANYTVHVVAADTRNFNWADGGGTPTYTIYEGDYMMLPKITGNSNGNDSYSRGSNKKYVYKIEGSTTTLNTTDYRIHEGVPDIMVVEGGIEKTQGDNAIVFFAKGQGTTFPDTLMIYGKAAGEVTLRAKDPQKGLYCDATIKIIPTTTLRSDSTNYVKNMSFPYTWDFTGDFDMTDIAANPHYWVEHSGYYAAGDGFFNVDWADRTNNGSSTNLYFKDFVAGNGDGTNTAGKYMPQFYGLQMMLQSSLYSPKIDRVQIKNYNNGNPGAPRFVISGGPTHLKLPKAPTQPDSYRIYMKIHTKGDTEVGHGLSTAPIKKYAVESGKYSTNCQLTANTDAIIFFDVDNTTSDNEGTIIYLSNTSIYWIATSTEAKSITQPGSMPYPAATYCYGKDLDFTLSKDANNSTFGTTSGSNLTAWYAAEENFDNTTKTVEMTQITEPFSQDQGVFLKTATGKAGNYYMISKAENTTSPAAGSDVSSTNMLKPLMNSQAVSRFDRDGSGDITHTNFFLNYRYKNYDEHNIDGEAIGDYNYPYSWRFYRIHDTVTGRAKTAYLHVPGEQKEVSASARRANRASGDLDTSGSMVHIIFKGETNTTGISTVDNDSVSVDDDAWYTLQGVRVEVPTKGGIYIHNGRKVVVK